MMFPNGSSSSSTKDLHPLPPSSQQEATVPQPAVVWTSTTTGTATSSSSSTPPQVIHSMHMDYIHDVAFDVYGRRMATCSGDRFVRIFELGDTGKWHIIAEWQAHKSSITQLSWAHPEFGSLLATCGTDHDAKIWEEYSPNTTMTTTTTATPGMTTHPYPHQDTTTTASSSSSLARWTCVTCLTEARRAVNCVQFAPRQFGLKIATGSADGCVRIYEAVDVMNLAQWPVQATITTGTTSSSPTTTSMTTMSTSSNTVATPASSSSGGGGGGGSTTTTTTVTTGGEGNSVTCLSWSTGRFEPPTLVVGIGGTNVGGSMMMTGSHTTTNTTSTTSSSSYPTSTTMMNHPMATTAGTTATTTTPTASNNNTAFLSACIIYRYSEASRQWQAILQLPISGKRILDVSWAPNVGRRFHYIASAEHDQLRIFKLSRQPQQQTSVSLSTNHKDTTTHTSSMDTSPPPQQQQQHSLQLESIQTLDSKALPSYTTLANQSVLTTTTTTSHTTPTAIAGAVVVPPNTTTSMTNSTFWRCQWNVTGTVLSSSGDGGVVQLWKADWEGKFKCVSYIVPGESTSVSVSSSTLTHTMGTTTTPSTTAGPGPTMMISQQQQSSFSNNNNSHKNHHHSHNNNNNNNNIFNNHVMLYPPTATASSVMMTSTTSPFVSSSFQTNSTNPSMTTVNNYNSNTL